MTDYEAFLARHQSDIEAMELPGAYGQYVHVAHAQLRFLRLCRPERLRAGRWRSTLRRSSSTRRLTAPPYILLRMRYSMYFLRLWRTI